jgi:regulator of PEP synthase PpsR (kinase-PPPase family)
MWIAIFCHSILQKSIDRMDKIFSMKAKSMNNKRQSIREYLTTYLNKMSAKGVS